MHYIKKYYTWKKNNRKKVTHPSNTNAATKKECSSKEFKCKNGYCIDKKRHCNRVRDCNDGSDEENCARNFLLEILDLLLIK